MHAPAWQVLRTFSSRSRPLVCRSLVSRLYPTPRRSFRSSPTRLRDHDPSDSPEIPETAYNYVAEESSSEAKIEDVVPETGEVTESAEAVPATPPNGKDRSGYGSASRRAGRNLRRKEIPPPQLPQWFLDKNVWLVEDRLSSEHHRPSLSELAKPDAEARSTWHPNQGSDDLVLHFFEGEISAEHATGKSITLSRHVLNEVKATVLTSLRLPYEENAASSRSHIILHCPQEGGTYFLDAIAQHVAACFQADSVQLDAQDIAEIGGGYIPDFKDLRGNTLSALGYEAYISNVPRGMQESDESAEDEFDEPEDAESHPRPRFPRLPRFPTQNASIIPIAHFTGNFRDIMKQLEGTTNKLPLPTPNSGQQNNTVVKMIDPREVSNQTRMNLLIETLLNAPSVKRASLVPLLEKNTKSEKATGNGDCQIPTTDQAEKDVSTDAERQPRNLIIMIKDYLEIDLTQNGSKILQRLHDLVQARRQEGQRIVILGTTSAKDLLPSFSKAGVRHVQSEQANGSTRTIVTPPLTNESILSEHTEERRQHINLRHLQDMLRRITPDPAQIRSIAFDDDLQSRIDSAIIFASGLKESIWSLDRMHRLATLALGMVNENHEMTASDVEAALNLIDASDNSKFDWVEKENQQEKGRNSLVDKGTLDAEERLRKLRRTCNTHEKKLLHGVVNPESIRTNFADVRATPEIIEALKTLTSLSLVRPDAFTYGVLATDRISGLMLYGPPGTGKTLLAKAVAKESGATMLEVCGSDVYDMYVGEGEKNIRAIFSLAKKLTPCIVFIDEADSILGSRGANPHRTMHREIINQFLREWDGMTDTNAFIMVATNRPFDLDEASLRRLPRRLLVDLPTEKDREAILGIHLKDETLAPDVSLPTLASQTPFYSGSDLKNVCVAAALACVREEFESAAAVTGKDKTESSSNQYPEKRTLELKHFTKAMEEISASISEDMGSLRAIRKFDEKYGDRRGRRKKGAGYGFATVKEGEKTVDGSARVRNQT